MKESTVSASDEPITTELLMRYGFKRVGAGNSLRFDLKIGLNVGVEIFLENDKFRVHFWHMFGVFHFPYAKTLNDLNVVCKLLIDKTLEEVKDETTSN